MAKPKKGTLHQILVPLVGSADFASIKSAITESDFNSGVTKKFYGWNTGGSAATTSGTISKTASLVRSGVFRVTLKTTENNYDMMMCRFNKTSCAEQIITWSNVDNDDSDIMSALTIILSTASDAASAAIQGNSRILLTQSLASDAVSALALANSRILLNESRISDAYSMLSDFYSDFQSRVPKRVATDSQLSDLHSDIRSFLVVMSGIQSDIYSLLSDANSDIRSQLTAGVAMRDSDLSDLRSAIAAGPAATITASDISNIASAVWSERYHVHSLASSFGSLFSTMATAANAASSRALINQSRISDVQSYLVAVSDTISKMNSDLGSKIGGLTATISASDISDIASAVWANAAGAAISSRVLLNLSRISDAQSAILVVQSMASDAASAAIQGNSRALVNQSQVSDILSLLTAMSDAVSDMNSDLRSLITVTGVALNTSALSDLRSAISAGPTGVLTTSDISDVASAVWANVIGARVDSRVLVMKSTLSDTYSLLSNVNSLAASAPTASDLASKILVNMASDLSDILSSARAGASRALLNQSLISDVYSQLSDFRSDIHSHMSTTGVQLNLSSLSDLRSAITAGAVLSTSDISDIASAVRAILVSDLSDILSAATQTNSRALVAQSYLSDIRSHVSDLQSDFQSRVPKRVATDSQLSDLASDIKSAVASVSVVLTVSNISDIASAVVVQMGTIQNQINSRVLINQSAISDIRSQLNAGIPLDASTMSDLRSAVAAVTLTASDISDIASAVRATVASDLSDIMSAVAVVNSRVLVNKSVISDVYSLVSDMQSDFQSRVPKAVATASRLLLAESVISDAHSAAVQANSRALVNQSMASDIYSLLGAVGVGVSGISDIASAVWATVGTEPTGVVGATGTMKETLDWLRALSRNKITQTATVQSVRNDADNADIASAAVSDDLTTAIRGRFGN